MRTLFRVLSILLVVIGAAPELLGVIFTLVGVMGFNLLFDLVFYTTASLQTMLPMTFVAAYAAFALYLRWQVDRQAA